MSFLHLMFRYELLLKYKSGDIFQIKALDFIFSKDSIIESWKFEKYDIDL